jgi:integrase
VTLPSGLKWRDRIAWDRARAYFLCQKKTEHPTRRKVGPRVFKFRRDAIAFRAAHDSAFHTRLLSHLGISPHRQIQVGPLSDEWLEHIRQLVERGRRDVQTLDHYLYIAKILRAGFHPSEDLTALTPARISQFTHWHSENSATEGAVTIKALSALRTMLRWKGIEPTWKIPTEDIQPAEAPKRDLEAELIVRLIAAMPKGSVEQAAAALKARTGMREVEIRKANVEDVDFSEKLIEPELRAKRKRKRHVYPLEDDVLELLLPFVSGKSPGDPLLDLGGRRLGESSLRVRLRRASERAGISPPIDSLGPIRAEVATIVKERRGLKNAAEWMGHEDERVTSRWYVKDRISAKQLREMRRVAKILAQVVPLQL